MMNSFSKLYIYRSVGFMLIMIILSCLALFILNSERQTAINKVDNNAIESVRNVDLVRMLRLMNNDQLMVKNISSEFLPATDTVAVIEEIERIGRISNVKLEISRAEKSKTDNSNSFLTMSVKVVGAWENVYQFLLKLDTFTYQHVTSRMFFVENHEEDGMHFWTLDMDMRFNLAK